MFSAAVVKAAWFRKNLVVSQACCRLKHWTRPSVSAPGRKSRSRSDVSKYEDPDEIRARFEEAENMQDWMQSHEHDQSQASEFVNSEAEKMKHVLIRKIIERKYFKEPQETNLLTWAAKEQIRYLNAEFPHEWTVERIATSFPISEHGVRKILRSKCTPKSAEEISKHDHRVQKHWLALNQGARIEGSYAVTSGGPLMLGYDQNNSSSFVSGAEFSQSKTAGILSSGKKGDLLNDNHPEPPGLFELIVKDYCEKTRKGNATLSKVTANETDDENLALDCPDYEGSMVYERNPRLTSGRIDSSSNVSLDELRSKFKSMSPSMSMTRNSKDAKPFGLSRNDLKSLMNVDFNAEREKDNVQNRRIRSREGDDWEFEAGKFDDGEFDERVGENAEISADRSMVTRSILGRKGRELAGRRRRIRTEEEEIIPAEEVELYAMKGTGKIADGRHSVYTEKREKDRREDRNRISSESNGYEKNRNLGKKELIEERSTFEKNEGFERDRRQDDNSRVEVSERILTNPYKKPTATVYDRIRYDVPGASVKGKSDRDFEAYLYDSEKGYSHPYGRSSDHPEPRVDVKGARRPTGLHSGGATYRKGNAYYNEDGELLFRTP